MCGIAGFFATSTKLVAAEARLAKMCQILAHRGPNGHGYSVKGRVGLAHTRLAVIDLHDRATQPMSTSDGEVICSFNGEIYNFKELRFELEVKGYIFRTESDTEVLLHGYRHWGHDLPAKLEGMFAFAIWTPADGTLFIARDRFGEKPLYFAWCDGNFVFASEPKAILSWPEFVARPNLLAIHDYLTYKISPGRQTAFIGIEKLPPAHSMTINTSLVPGQRPQQDCYWTQAEENSSLVGLKPEDLKEEFFELFDAAISKRLVADVPVGAFLSGGVDSSAIVARAAALREEPLMTFSAGFATEGFDETVYAREVAERYGTDHRSFIMDESLATHLPQLVWNYSDPFADSSALVTSALAAEVRKHVTVALSGDGGDELFLGYQRYKNLHSGFSTPEWGTRASALGGRLERLIGPLCPRDIYAKSFGTFNDTHKEWGYGPALCEFLFTPSSDRLLAELDLATQDTALSVAGRADLNLYLPDDLMVKTDIATMAVGLEGRCPFLDHDLANWALKLPQQVRALERNEQIEGKGLLKALLEPHLSDTVLYRKKMGFGVPIAAWLKGPLKDEAYNLLTSNRFRERGLIRPQFIDWMLQSHMSGHTDHSTRIWALMVLEVWFQTFIDQPMDGPLDLAISLSRRGVQEVHM